MSPAAKHPRTQTPPSNAALERLAILVGEWEVTISNMSFLDDKTATAKNHTSFEWLEDGKFLLQRSDPPTPDFPRSTAVIGPDDQAGTYRMLYFDSRGVSRIYEMSLTEREWKLWRNFPEFSQRFAGAIGPDGMEIRASWEKSFDGAHWEHDFDLTYRKVK